MSNVDKKALEESIISAARSLYNPKLPYHNFDHAFTAANKALEFVGRCEKESVPINRDVVYYALLFHDAGYHENQKEKGFASKEEYSAFLADEILTKLGFNKAFIGKVKQAILATLINAIPRTNEEKVVRAADVASMAASYENYLDINRRIKNEYEFLLGKSINWKEYREKSKEIIENHYLNQDLHLTSVDKDKSGKSIILEKIRVNLSRFLKEDEKVLNDAQVH